jgi:hypothetical protein
MLSQSEQEFQSVRSYNPDEIPAADTNRIFGDASPDFEQVPFVDETSYTIADIAQDMRFLEASTDTRLADHSDRILHLQNGESVQDFLISRLQDRVLKLEQQEHSEKLETYARIIRRRWISDVFKPIAITGLGLTALLFIGSALSPGNIRKETLVEAGLVAGLVGVAAMAIGTCLED